MSSNQLINFCPQGRTAAAPVLPHFVVWGRGDTARTQKKTLMQLRSQAFNVHQVSLFGVYLSGMFFGSWFVVAAKKGGYNRAVCALQSFPYRQGGLGPDVPGPHLKCTVEQVLRCQPFAKKVEVVVTHPAQHIETRSYIARTEDAVTPLHNNSPPPNGFFCIFFPSHIYFSPFNTYLLFSQIVLSALKTCYMEGRHKQSKTHVFFHVLPYLWATKKKHETLIFFCPLVFCDDL